MKTFPTILKAVAAVAAGLLLFSCTKKAELTVSTHELTFVANSLDAQPQTVTVTTNTAWRATTSDNWLRIDPPSGPESGSFTVSVTKSNTTLEDLPGKITVIADDLIEEIKVTQKAIVPVLSVEANGWDLNAPIPAKGTGARQLLIACNVSWTLSVTGGGDWFVYGPDSGTGQGALGVDYVTIGFKSNYDFEDRSVKLDFTAAGGKTASITFKQLAAEPSRQIDSLALVAIYNAAKGAEWADAFKWDLSTPISEWRNVTLTEDRVTKLQIVKNAGVPEEWTLPEDVTKMTALTDLRINTSKLKGEFPEFLYGMTQLTQLWLTGNKLTGSLSSKLGQLVNLTHLYIDQNADLGGELPKEIGNLTKLQNINISQTKIGGTIPTELGKCLDLANFMAFKTQLATPIPDIWDNFSKIAVIQLYGNPNMEGDFPDVFTKVNVSKNLSLWLYDCNFTGNIPESYGAATTYLNQFRLNGNKMKGVIPAAVQAHANWSKWNAEKYILPQQDGYGLTLE